MQKEMEKRPNILLITTDTQRVDTLHCMGYPKEVSPNLDEPWIIERMVEGKGNVADGKSIEEMC